MNTSSIFIADAVRTPRGKGRPGGALQSVLPIDLLAQVLEALRDRTNLDTSLINDVIIGCVTQVADQGGNIAKSALLWAGWDVGIPAATVNRFCASGLSATLLAAGQARSSDGLTIGGGVESMSRVPMRSDAAAPEGADADTRRRLTSVPIGVTADLLATLDDYDRVECDEYAVLSQQRAGAAAASGRFSRSLVPVLDRDGGVVLGQDETIRPLTTVESLRALRPAFETVDDVSESLISERFPGLPPLRHVHHAGNSPTLADGAAAVLLGTDRALAAAGMTARARIVSAADFCAEPLLAQTGAVGATQLALKRAALSADDMDVFEVRDSFAAVNLHYLREVGISTDRFNVNGSSIALGHAVGATGAMLVSTALDELERIDGKYALIAIAGAAGVASCCIIER